MKGGIMNISDRIANLYEMVDESYLLARQGRILESDELYVRCYTAAYNMLANFDSGMFSEEELNFLNKVISEFNYEK